MLRHSNSMYRLALSTISLVLTVFLLGANAAHAGPASRPALAPIGTATTILTVDPEPSIVGQSYTVDFRVVRTGENPDGFSVKGTVTVTDGTGGTCSYGWTGDTPVYPNGWEWHCSLTSTSAGTKTLTATFVAYEPEHFGDSSGTGSHTVLKASPMTSITSTPNPSAWGQAVSFAATVSGGGVTPTGNVTFKNGGTTITGCSAVALNSSGQATCSTSSLAVGTRSISADYGGDANYYVSTATYAQVVNRANTTTTVTSSANPSDCGDSVIFTVNVTSSTGGTPTGTVDFYVTGTPASHSLSGGSTTFTVSSFTAGTHNLLAVYNGNANYDTSDSGLYAQVVVPADTATTVTASPNPSTFGQNITFTATVSSDAGTPTGNVVFKNGGTTITGCGAQGLNGSGQATCTTSALAAGTRSISAEYSGDTNYSTSNSATYSQTVNQATTMTTITSSANPSVRGQNVTFTASVRGVSPTGTVTFKDGGADMPGCVAISLSGGNAACDVIAPALGPHNITVDYSGDAGNNPGTGVLTQVVNKANTTTAISSSENPILAGHPVTFTVTVSAVAPGGGMPTGSVTLYETTLSGAARASRARLASQALVDGVATIPVPRLTNGAHTFLAIYDGDANCNASTSAIHTQNAYLLYYYFPWFPHQGQ